ncbi:MAG: hydantoinase B/oxoprolinase family protein, partial [Alphaproteobacteria bacterium]|nr:hydantoinase B/oxoprolinase family protein [Alphaproteobacteria bacterium]
MRDPVASEIVRNRLREIAGAMEHALFHSGYSPILRESLDGSAGFTDATGRGVLGSGGIPYHVLLYPSMVGRILGTYAATLADGDCFVANDPYKVANSHVPDVVLATPVYHAGHLIAFAVSISHKPDVGGIVAGSSSAFAREVFHDGLLIPPVRLKTQRGFVPEIEAIIRNNSRAPDELIGDIRAQVGAVLLGAAKLRALCDEYSRPEVQAAMAWLLASTSERVRAEIARWPDGTAEASGRLDHDGVDRRYPVHINVRVTKRGDRLVIDFSGTSSQAAGPFNAPRGTVESVSQIALVTASDNAIPVNSGLAEAIEFVIPPGSLVNPRYPATVNNYFPAAHLAYTCVQSALAKFNPSQAIAPAGFSSGAIALGYAQDRSGRAAVQYELNRTGLGATAGHDGVSLTVAMNQFTPGTPIEILESEYPLRVVRFDMRQNSGGPGRYRGGLGAIREYELLDDSTLTVRATNYRFGSWGLFGGAPSPPAGAALLDASGGAESLDSLETRAVRRGQSLRMIYAGGSGCGAAIERPAAAVLLDYRNGYVSRDQAR